MSRKITTTYQCMKCLFRAGTEIIEKTLSDEKARQKAASAVFRVLSGAPPDVSPVVTSNEINVLVREMSGVYDPYLEDKRQRNLMAEKTVPWVKKTVDSEEDPFFGSLKAAAAGNILDKVAGDEGKLDEALKHAFQQGFALNRYDRLKQMLFEVNRILYIADNSGEIYFDSLVVEKLVEMGKSVVFCVRGGPAVDDALEEDWKACGLDGITDLVTTGCTHLGCVMDQVGEPFLKAFNDAQLIIAKGMGNFETLAHLDDSRIFCILKAKCSCVADALGVNTGDLCLVQL